MNVDYFTVRVSILIDEAAAEETLKIHKVQSKKIIESVLIGQVGQVADVLKNY